MKKIIFLSNTPTPYQLDFFNEVNTKHPVKAIFLKQGGGAQNVSWKLDTPEWLTVLEKNTCFTALCKQLEPKEISSVILGGYKIKHAIPLLFWAKSKGIQVYYWMERPMPTTPIKNLLRKLIHKFLFSFATGIMAVDGEAQEYYSKFNSNTFRLPYSINCEKYKLPRPKNVTKAIRFLFVGQFIDRKGIPELIEAFKNISPKKSLLSFVGKGPMDIEVKEFCQKTGHNYIGFSQPNKLPKIFSNHDVFIFPSKYDGWGVVVPEAMASSLPVISTKGVGSFVDLNRNNDVGIFCAANAESIETATMEYINNPKTLAIKSKQSFKVVNSSLANSKNAAKYMLEKIINE